MVKFWYNGSCVYGFHKKNNFVTPHLTPSKKWKIDCLKTIESANTQQISSPRPLSMPCGRHEYMVPNFEFCIINCALIHKFSLFCIKRKATKFSIIKVAHESNALDGFTKLHFNSVLFHSFTLMIFLLPLSNDILLDKWEAQLISCLVLD